MQLFRTIDDVSVNIWIFLSGYIALESEDNETRVPKGGRGRGGDWEISQMMNDNDSKHRMSKELRLQNC